MAAARSPMRPRRAMHWSMVASARSRCVLPAGMRSRYGGKLAPGVLHRSRRKSTLFDRSRRLL